MLTDLISHYNQFVFKHVKKEVTRALFMTWKRYHIKTCKKKPAVVTPYLWHLHLGHLGKAAIEHLIYNIEGVRF